MFFKPAALFGAAALFTAAYAAPTPSNTEASTSYGSSYGSSYESSYESKEEPKHQPPAQQHQPEPKHEPVAAHTSSAAASHQTESPSYGSGYSDWGSGYDDCVSQCVAKYGKKPGDSPYKPSVTAGHTGSVGGNGVVHTVIVAPQQGVLRFVPFAVNASVGDTIKFMWGANNHTVTEGSALLPCNKSGTVDSFASGLQQKDFVFERVVNTTEPTYYFCNAPTHCQKGMFGIINPAVNLGAPTSAGLMMSELTSKNPDLKAYASLVQKETVGKAGDNWGTNIDLKALPEWAHPLAAENIMFTRSLLASNQEVIQEDGSIDLSSISTTPLQVPPDVPAALAQAAASGPSSAANAPVPAATTESAPASTETSGIAGGLNNGAGALTSSKALVAVMAVVATFLML